jgi:hypothetical protein
MIRLCGTKVMRPIDFLRSICNDAANVTVENILTFADRIRNDQVSVERESRNVRTVSRETIRKRIETLARDGRMSAATRSLEELGGMIAEDCNVKDVRQISTEEACQAIARLHPDATAEDIIDIPEELEEPIKITDYNVLESVKHLPVGSAAGYTGWTYAAIHAIVLPRDNNNEMLSVVRKFFNYLLAGKLLNRRLTDSRAVLIPKDDGGLRPLGIGEAWYRFLGRTVSMVAFIVSA